MIDYDQEARATGWRGPEVALGLAYEHLCPGQSILDLGIGTGLGAVLFRKAGLHVHGMDLSEEMLGACRRKGFTELTRHDLTRPPYPYPPESMDHVLCIGVLFFFRDLEPIFRETARILRPGGQFILVAGDRTDREDPAMEVGPDRSGTGSAVTMYRHSPTEIAGWTGRVDLSLDRDLAFTAYMDRERTRVLPSRAYVAVKGSAR